MTDFLSAELQRELFHERPATAFFDGLQDGVITAVIGRQVWFTVPDFDTDSAFGPATIDIGTPAVGDKIVVAFVGTGVDKPRVVSLPSLGADDVGVTPFSDITATDVQAALEQLNDNAYSPSNPPPITKADIDALDVDAGTLDGHDSSFFYSSSNPPPASGSMINQTIRGTIALSAFQNSLTATVASVNTAKTQLRYLGSDAISQSTGSQKIDAYLTLTNATTITAQGGATSASLTVSYELTEWT